MGFYEVMGPVVVVGRGPGRVGNKRELGMIASWRGDLCIYTVVVALQRARGVN